MREDPRQYRERRQRPHETSEGEARDNTESGGRGYMKKGTYGVGGTHNHTESGGTGHTQQSENLGEGKAGGAVQTNRILDFSSKN